MRSVSRIHASLAALAVLMGAAAAASGLGGCSSASDPASDTNPADAATPEQADAGTYAAALNAFSQSGGAETFHWVSEGSQLLPYAWFGALEQSTSTTLFRDDANLASFGYLPSPVSKTNPDGYPLGFSRDDDPTTGAWMGMNCAACHTAEITYQGQALRIEGGSSNTDLWSFLTSLEASLQATGSDAAKFDRFATTVLGKSYSASASTTLRTQLKSETDALIARMTRDKPSYPPGRGRVDPFGNIFNEVLCAATNMPQNCATPSAPLKMPHLWGAPELEWVQANASAYNPLPRNMSQAMGVFARTSVDSTCSIVSTTASLVETTVCNFRSTTRLQKTASLEEALDTLAPPKWPAAMLGAIDQTLATQGKTVYADHCLQCHSLPTYPMTVPNQWGKTLVKITTVPLAEIGTDPAMANAIANRRADPGPYKSAFPAADVGPDGKIDALEMLTYAAGGVLVNTLYDELGFTDLSSVPQYFGDRDIVKAVPPGQLQTYKARPLAGIALAGYYLHNGAVPNVYEMTLPSGKRSKTFYVGNREYDPKKLGYVSDVQTPGSSLFDTSLAGSSNGGHEYGAGLSDSDRWALLEYIKTI